MVYEEKILTPFTGEEEPSKEGSEEDSDIEEGGGGEELE